MSGTHTNAGGNTDPQPNQSGEILFRIKENIEPEKGLIKSTVAVNGLKIISWFLLMGVGVFICFVPLFAASFGFTFPAMLALGLIIAIPSLMMTVAAALNIFHKRGVAKLIKNIASITMALAASAIGILLFAAPGLPIISAFVGMIGGLGSFGALLTKISLITFGAYKLLDAVRDFWIGSRARGVYGAIGNNVVSSELELFWDNKGTNLSDVDIILRCAIINLPKVIRNLAIILLGVVVCCKISLVVGLILAISFSLKLVANLFDKHREKRLHRFAKVLNNFVRVTFGAALLYTGILFLQPAVLFGVLGKLSFVAAAFPGVIGLGAGISLIVFGALMLFKAVTDIICGDKEKLKQCVYEITTSHLESVRDNLQGELDFLDMDKKDGINKIVPGLIVEKNMVLGAKNQQD